MTAPSLSFFLKNVAGFGWPGRRRVEKPRLKQGECFFCLLFGVVCHRLFPFRGRSVVCERNLNKRLFS